MGVAYAEATLVACSSVGGGDGVPGRTSLYREVCELERRVRAVDHMTSLARLARGSDAMDDEREKAFAREEPCLGRARELLEVSDDLASAETAVLAWEGVRAASRAAESGDADALETAAETATRLETALRRVATRFRDPRRPEGSAETRKDENERARVMCAKALDALHAAAHALRAAAAEREARAKKSAEKNVVVPEKKRPETGDEIFSFSRLAPRLAATCGRWSRAHAAMGAELRGKNPLDSAFRGFREDAFRDSENDDDEATPKTFSGEDVKTSPRRAKTSRDAPSEWARHAMAACRVVTEAASEALCTRETDHDHDHDGEKKSVRVVHIEGGSSTRHPHAESNGAGAALTPFLADLLLRTARAVLNFAAHQPRLWPKSRTLLQMCAARRDAEAVDEAVAACVKVFEEAYVSRVRKEKENDQLVFSDEFSLTRALVVARRAGAHSRAGVSSLTEGVASCVRRACAEAYETAPTGSWSSRKVLGNAKKSAGTGGSIACFSASAAYSATRTNAISDADANANKSAFLSGLGTPSGVSRTCPSSQTSLVVELILTPLFVSLDRLGDGSLAARTKSVCVTRAGAAALAALLYRVQAEGPGGVRLFSGGAERLEADVEALIVVVEAFLFSATKKQKQKQKEKETSLSVNTRLFRAAAKRGRAVVAVAKAAGIAASSAKGQAYAAARAALGAEEAETWRKVCVK
jgi:hypothetical protein